MPKFAVLSVLASWRINSQYFLPESHGQQWTGVLKQPVSWPVLAVFWHRLQGYTVERVLGFY